MVSTSLRHDFLCSPNSRDFGLNHLPDFCTFLAQPNGQGYYSRLRQHSRPIFGMDHLHANLNRSVYHMSRSVQCALRTFEPKLRILFYSNGDEPKCDDKYWER